jgi:hypothetical protein
MPGGGLFCLVAYGAQNVLLSGNPDFTYFYKTYKKYSHFSEESVTQVLSGPQELSFYQPIQVRAKIQRVADLVRDIYFTFDLPDIYCKYIDTVLLGRTDQYNFNWVRYIGCHIVQNIAFFIGGQKIQEFDGNYMIAKAQADLDTDEYAKWRKLVGDVPELVSPSQGIYAGGSTFSGYPIVFNDPDNNNVNRPSIFGRTITVPLPLWFSDATFNALPLVALQQAETEIHITLRPIQELYTVIDKYGFRVRPGFQIKTPYDTTQPTNLQYEQSTDLSETSIKNFLVDFGVETPFMDTWQINPRLQMTYVYLTESERKIFATQELKYLMRQITIYKFPGIQTRQFLDLDSHGTVNRIFILPRRSDSLLYRNDVANFTNWPNYNVAPFIPNGSSVTPLQNQTMATGRFVAQGQQQIIRSLRLLGDGNELQEEKSIDYFQNIVAWKYLKGVPDTGILVYPFALHSPSGQPDGSLNTSRIKSLQADVNVYPLPSYNAYDYNITFYVENYNWVVISSGLGGMKYSI